MEKVRGNVCKNLFKSSDIVNNILERIWKETVVAHFEVISWNFAAGTDENERISYLAYPLLRPSIKPVKS